MVTLGYAGALPIRTGIMRENAEGWSFLVPFGWPSFYFLQHDKFTRAYA